MSICQYSSNSSKTLDRISLLLLDDTRQIANQQTNWLVSALRNKVRAEPYSNYISIFQKISKSCKAIKDSIPTLQLQSTRTVTDQTWFIMTDQQAQQSIPTFKLVLV